MVKNVRTTGKKARKPLFPSFNVEWLSKMGPRNIDIGGKGENNMTCPEYLLP